MTSYPGHGDNEMKVNHDHRLYDLVHDAHRLMQVKPAAHSINATVSVSDSS